ncbi:MAG: hypothetical protein LQ337_007639 [Flavoplaca oasis]|nr:MAG: hypothetical protein LQ337_007639 [Flavoplaca oasis]
MSDSDTASSQIGNSRSEHQDLTPVNALKVQLDASRRILTQAAGSALGHLGNAAQKYRAFGDDGSRSRVDEVVAAGKKSVNALNKVFDNLNTLLMELAEYEVQGFEGKFTETEERMFSKITHLNRRIKEEQAKTRAYSDEQKGWDDVDKEQSNRIKMLEDKVTSQDLQIQEHLQTIQKLQRGSAAQRSTHNVFKNDRHEKSPEKVYDEGQASSGAEIPGAVNNQAGGGSGEGADLSEDYASIGIPSNYTEVPFQRKRASRRTSPTTLEKPAKRQKTTAADLSPMHVQDAPGPSSSRVQISLHNSIADSNDESQNENASRGSESDPSTDGEIPLGSQVQDNATRYGKKLDERFGARELPYRSMQPQSSASVPEPNPLRTDALRRKRTSTMRASETANTVKRLANAGKNERPPVLPENINPDQEPWIKIDEFRRHAFTYGQIPPALFDRIRQQMNVWDGKKGPDAAGGSWRDGAKGRSKGHVKCANCFANHDGSDMRLAYACKKCEERHLVCVGVLHGEVQIQPLLPIERRGASKADLAYWVRES